MWSAFRLPGATPLLLVLCFQCALHCAAYDYQWREAWSIHRGNCGFGYIWPDEPLGWDVTAITDGSGQLEFSGSCGRCYEIRCNPSKFEDGYGSRLDRNNACYDPESSVVVRVTDSCPCHYPGNYYSNKRWCCGDMPHFDLSLWAYEKLASTKWGVIGLEWRAVPCNHKPWKPAPTLPNPTPGESPPYGAKNPLWSLHEVAPPENKWSQQQGETLYQPFSTYADAVASISGNGASASASAVASSSASSTAVTAVASATSSAPSFANELQHWIGNNRAMEPNLSGMQSSGWVFKGALQNGWWDRSWSSTVDWRVLGIGVFGGTVVCADLQPNGALSVGNTKGFFQGSKSIEFWVKTDDGRPDVDINIGSDQASCTPQRLKALPTYGKQKGWSKFAFNLGQFGSSYSKFTGCGGRGSWDTTFIELKNTYRGQQTVCLDQLRLLP